MIYFITFMMSTSVTIIVMLLFLIIVARKEQYACSWIYGLIKLGLILLTVPAFALTCSILYYILRREILPIEENQPSVTLIFKEKYSILKRFYSYRPYVWNILYGWAIGAGIVVLKIAIDIYKFYKDIVCRSKRVTDETILNSVNRVKQDLSIKKPIFVYHNEEITSPMLIKMKDYMLIIGDMDLTQEQFCFAVTHELVHLKRKHILFKRLSIVIRVIYWFHPFVYYFLNFFSDYCELDCDREVLKNTTKEQKMDYVEMYLKLLSGNIYKNPVIQSSFIDSKKKTRVERRIKNMMNQNIKKNIRRMAVVSIGYVLLFPTIVYGATIGGLKLQNEFVLSYKDPYVEELEPIQFVEEEQQPMIRNHVEYMVMDLRIDNSVDKYIEPGDCVAIRVDSDSSALKVSLFCEPDTNSFKVSVNGKSVTSVNGMLSHRFSVSANKTYYVYIDNLSDERIHVAGSIHS